MADPGQRRQMHPERVLACGFLALILVGGILLALGGRISISPYVTTVSFLIYVVCRLIKRSRTKGRIRQGQAKAA